MSNSLYSMTERRRILERWRRSGLSADAFSVRVGVHPSSLYAWRRSMSPMQGAAAGAGGRAGDAAGVFVEIVAADPAGADSGPRDPDVEAHDEPRADAQPQTHSCTRSQTQGHSCGEPRSHAGVEILVQDPRDADGQLAVRLHAGFDPVTLLRALDALRGVDALRDSAAEKGVQS